MTKNYQRQTSLHQEWLEMWKEFEQEFGELPYWAQKIMLRDISTTFKNRMRVIEKVKSLPTYNSIQNISLIPVKATSFPMDPLVISKAAKRGP